MPSAECSSKIRGLTVLDPAVAAGHYISHSGPAGGRFIGQLFVIQKPAFGLTHIFECFYVHPRLVANRMAKSFVSGVLVVKIHKSDLQSLKFFIRESTCCLESLRQHIASQSFNNKDPRELHSSAHADDAAPVLKADLSLSKFSSTREKRYFPLFSNVSE